MEFSQAHPYDTCMYVFEVAFKLWWWSPLHHQYRLLLLIAQVQLYVRRQLIRADYSRYPPHRPLDIENEKNIKYTAISWTRKKFVQKNKGFEEGILYCY